VNDGLKRIEPMLRPIYEALCARNRQGDFHQADETRWPVFVLVDGKKGYGWWLWIILGADTVVYLLDPSRGHKVPETHFGPQASGVLEVDRYSGYKAMAQVKSGRIALAFCWAHVRRDFVGVGKSWSELTPWAIAWLRRIRHLYQVHRKRLRHPPGSLKFQEQEALLRQALEAIRAEALEELADPQLRQPCRKVLESLQEHWTGLIRFWPYVRKYPCRRADLRRFSHQRSLSTRFNPSSLRFGLFITRSSPVKCPFPDAY
jgi:transposase